MKLKLNRLVSFDRSSIKVRMLTAIFAGLGFLFLYFAGARARAPLILLLTLCLGNLIICAVIILLEKKRQKAKV